MSKSETPELLTTRQAAERLQVSVETVLAWIGSRQLRAIDVSAGRRVKPRWRVETSTLSAFLQTRASVCRPARKKATAAGRGGHIIEFIR